MKLIALLIVALSVGYSYEDDNEVDTTTEVVLQTTFETESPSIATIVTTTILAENDEVSSTPNNIPTTTTTTPRARSRSAKRTSARESATAKPELLQLRVIKPDSQELHSSSRALPKSDSGKISVNILRPEGRAFTKASKASSSESEQSEKLSTRRGKVRYLSGKELGRDAPAVKFESKYEADKFKFSYETKDGQVRSENGIFESLGTENQSYVVKGSYSFFDAEGIEYTVNYTADDHGYHPVIVVNNPNKQ